MSFILVVGFSLGCRLSLTNGCAHVASEKAILGGGRHLDWMALNSVGGEINGSFSAVLFSGLLGCWAYFQFSFVLGPLGLCPVCKFGFGV